jgi:hypothetical protein
MKTISLWAVLELDGYNAADVVAVYANKDDADYHASKSAGLWVQQIPEVYLNKRSILGRI